ncbi:MAG: M48 family metallopeptidase [Bacteroidia bacterium]|jgi:Zn-dependent protease with chaperone function
MNLIYKARYYNGKSSTPYTVDILIKEDGIQIQYESDAREKTSVVWEKHSIHELEYSSALITLRSGKTFPYEQLEITDPKAIQTYTRLFKVAFHKRVLRGNGALWLGIILVSFTALLLLGYFVLLPWAADWGASKIPKDYEIELGKELYKSVLEGENIDSGKTKAINQFFKELGTEQDYPIQITVVKKDIANAFALPGGGIVVYSHILDSMQSYEELAALLAHEFSHVQLKHATRNIFQSLSGRLLLSVFIGDLGGVSAVILQQADNLRSLGYSRKFEKEADENGLRILAQNSIDAEGMVRLFEQLGKEEVIELNEMLSTHPDIENRIEGVRAFKKENPYVHTDHPKLNSLFETLKGRNDSWE